MSLGNGSAPANPKLRLCAMMFLQFFIWGAWYPLVFDYVPSLGFSKLQVALVLGAFNLSALVAMFFSNQFVDRTFSAEKFLAFSHLVGGAAMIGLAFVRSGWSSRQLGMDLNLSFIAFFGLMLLHTLFYVPTISITNAIAFANLKDPAKEFGAVRLWGTIGWIAAAWPFVFLLVDWNQVPAMGQEAVLVKKPNGSTAKVIAVTEANKESLQQEMAQKKRDFEENTGETVKTDFMLWLKTALGTPLTDQAFRDATTYTFLAAGLVSLLLAAFSLVLPHTPPKPSSEPLAWLEAMKLLAHPFVLVLFVVTFLDAAIHQAYFYWAATYLKEGVKLPGNWITPVMSIGQIAEIGTMAFLGYVLKSLGWRMTMVIGILGHAGRFAVFAFFPEQVPAIAVNVLHGICYAFFFATLYIFIDEYFPKDARTSAQGLFNMLILGVGPFVSNFVSGELAGLFKKGDSFDFQAIFLVPMGTALVAALLLLLLFHPPARARPEAAPE
jgi:hypothetical protein